MMDDPVVSSCQMKVTVLPAHHQRKTYRTRKHGWGGDENVEITDPTLVHESNVGM